MTRPVTKINVHAIRSCSPIENHRKWCVTIDTINETSTNSTLALPRRQVQLKDPFTIAEYRDYERQSARSDAIHLSETSSLGDAIDHGQGLSLPDSKLARYRQALYKALQLEEVRRHGGIVKISIGEDLDRNDREQEHFSSIHGLLWELLEQEHDGDIIVTRWITGIARPGGLPRGFLTPRAPIRLLLVVARGFHRKEDSTFRDPPSVVYDTLYTMAKHLRHRGIHDRLFVDVVRPGTFAELKRHLRRGNKHEYDMVHFDVHGCVTGEQETPQLLFARPDAFNAESSSSVQSRPARARPYTESRLGKERYHYVNAREVAQLLKDHHITVAAFSACLSSYAQGKPLSNMCHVFAKFGICAVTGMSFTVQARMAQAYYTGFYSAVVLNNEDFRTAAVQGRHRLKGESRKLPSWGGEKDRQPETWPVVTTYFATAGLDRTDSLARLGRDTLIEAVRLCRREKCWPLIFVIIGCLFLLPLMVNLRILGGLAGLLILWHIVHFVTFRNPQPPPVNPSHSSAFEKDLNDVVLKHSVGLMAIEDRLKALKQLFIQISPPLRQGRLEERLLSLKDQWLTTNFADVVEIMPASAFRSNLFSPVWIYLLKHRLSRLLDVCWKCRQSPDRAQAEPDSPLRTVLIISGLEDIIKKGKPRHYKVLERMDKYIRSMEARHTGLYLVFVSSKNIGWFGCQWSPDDYLWTEAKYFLTEEFITLREKKP